MGFKDRLAKKKPIRRNFWGGSLSLDSVYCTHVYIHGFGVFFEKVRNVFSTSPESLIKKERAKRIEKAPSKCLSCVKLNHSVSSRSGSINVLVEFFHLKLITTVHLLYGIALLSTVETTNEKEGALKCAMNDICSVGLSCTITLHYIDHVPSVSKNLHSILLLLLLVLWYCYC